MKKGFLLSLDAIAAITLLLMVSLFLAGMAFTYASPELRYQRYYYAGKDLSNVLENSKIEAVSDMVNLGDYGLTQEDMNRTMLDVIGSFWAEGNKSYAENLTKEIFENVVNGTGLDYEILFNSESIYTSDPSYSDFLARLSTVVSGYEKTKPVNGFLAKVYMTKVSKSNSHFSYFGGYVGDGNITKIITLPVDANVTNVYIEMNVGNNFSLHVNNQSVGSYIKTAVNFSADNWTVCNQTFNPTYCSYFTGGDNTVELNFTSKENNYIGGGYLKVTYKTSELTEGKYVYSGNTNVGKYYFPGIKGIINIYSSFYVPGTLNNITTYLHYKSEYPVYLTMGNVTVYQNNTTGEVGITLNDSLLNSLITGETGKNKTEYLSNETIPLRFGTRNVSFLLGVGGNADIVLITDRTASMDNCDVDINCTTGLCDASDPCHDRRDYVAQRADRRFISTLLNVSGNRVGTIGYGKRTGSVCSFRDITSDNQSLQNRIDDYANEWCGYTCISCGIDAATRLILEEQALHGLNKTLYDNNTYVELGSSGGRYDNYDITQQISFNSSKFVKARLSVFGRNLYGDSGIPVKDYMNCVYLNGKYLGRMCYPAEANYYGYHDCVFDLRHEWLNSGQNTVIMTSGTVNGCMETGTQDDWEFKDVRIVVWELNNKSSVMTNVQNNSEMNVNGRNVFHSGFVNLWEVSQDYPNPVDFTSGFNSSANTFGFNAGDDGWDWDPQDSSGPYGYDDDIYYFHLVNDQIEFNNRNNATDNNDCSGEDCSGAYGIQVNITDNIWNAMQAGDSLAVSFYYSWDDNPSDPFEDGDQVWIKARFWDRLGNPHYLGSNLDTGDTGEDGDPEVDTRDNPDENFNGFYIGNVTQWVDGPGWYYLDLGGKILANSNSEWGYFRFDDISIGLYNSSLVTQTVSVAKNLSLDIEINDTKKSARLTFEADDVDPYFYDCIYVNDRFLGRVRHQEWNRNNTWQNVSFDVPVFWLNNGTNDITFTGGTRERVQTGTDGGCFRTGSNDYWKFRNVKLELTHANETYPYDRFKGMLVMSDGIANTRIGDCTNCQDGSPDPSQEAIDKACEAHNLYNISIYSVAFGAGAENDTLQGIACCDDCSHFYTSNNADDLLKIYERIAHGFMNLSFAAQAINVSGNITWNNTLFTDSYISFNYTPNIRTLEYGEITLNFESPRLRASTGNAIITDNNTGTKEGWFIIPTNTEVVTKVLDSKITSYSSLYWTDRVFVNSSNTPNQNWTRVYWLGNYSNDYKILGDPYIVQIPPHLLKTGGNNSFKIGTGLNPSLPGGLGASPDDRVIYALGITGISLTEYSDILPKAEGSRPTIYYDTDGDNIPESSVTVDVGHNPSDVFDPENDSIDNGFMKLMNRLNFISDLNPNIVNLNHSGSGPTGDGDGSNNNPIDLEVTEEVEFQSDFISQIPSMWGPAIMEVRIWG